MCKNPPAPKGRGGNQQGDRRRNLAGRGSCRNREDVRAQPVALHPTACSGFNLYYSFRGAAFPAADGLDRDAFVVMLVDEPSELRWATRYLDSVL
jgi:hypothetical protein